MVDRSKLPTPGPELPFTFPEIRCTRLSNGMAVWTAEHREVPLISALVMVRAGAAYDPADRPGLAAITGDLLDEGCGSLDALAMHERLGRLGAQLDSEVGADATLIGLTTLARTAEQGLSILADMVRAPRLDERDFARVRDLRVNRLLQLREMPPAVAERLSCGCSTERIHTATCRLATNRRSGRCTSTRRGRFIGACTIRPVLP